MGGLCEELCRTCFARLHGGGEAGRSSRRPHGGGGRVARGLAPRLRKRGQLAAGWPPAAPGTVCLELPTTHEMESAGLGGAGTAMDCSLILNGDNIIKDCFRSSAGAGPPGLPVAPREGAKLHTNRTL